MKKQYLLYVSVVFLSINSIAQETFFKFVHGWRSHQIMQLENEYRVCGLSMNSNYNNYTYIEAISQNADSLSSFSLPVDTAIHEFRYKNSFAETYSSNYVASYFQGVISQKVSGLLIKYSSNYQDTISTKIINIGGSDTFLYLCIVKNDTSLIWGSYNYENNNSYTTFLETDTLGNIRWQKDFDCAGDCNLSPFHILPTVDNGFIFTCYEDHINGSPGVEDVQMAIIKTDSVGNLEWRNSWGGDTTKNWGSWVVPLDDGNFLYAWTDNDLTGYLGNGNYFATIRFIKFDIDGNIIWQKDMYNDLPTTGDPDTATTGHFYHISQMELMPDGNIIIAGESEQFTGGNACIKGLLLKIDQDANYLWHRELTPPGLACEDNTASYQYMKILGVTFTSDGGLALAGEYFSAPGGNIFPDGFQSAYIYKLDEHGCYEPNCHVGVEEVKSEMLDNTKFKIYPNPAKDYFTVEYSFTSNDKPIVLKVTDVQGKVLYTKELQYKHDQLVIDAADYLSGTYYISLFAGKQLIQSKSIQIHK